MTVPITRWSMICFLGSFQAIYIGQWYTAHNSFLFFSFNRCFHGGKRSSTVIINGIIFGHFQFFPFFIKQPASNDDIPNQVEKENRRKVFIKIQNQEEFKVMRNYNWLISSWVTTFDHASMSILWISLNILN